MSDSPDKKCPDCSSGISRRGFLSSVGAGAAVAASLTEAPNAPAQEVVAGGSTVTISLRVNGSVKKVIVDPRWSLLFVLREGLGLTARIHHQAICWS